MAAVPSTEGKLDIVTNLKPQNSNDQAATEGKLDIVTNLPRGNGVEDTTASSALADFAAQIGLELSGTLGDRADAAAVHMNRSHRHRMAAGLLLLSIKAECAHGEFMQIVSERGFGQRTANREMDYAEFVLTRSAAERVRLLEMPRSKVMAIAEADPEVIKVLLEDGGESIDDLSVRALKERVRILQAAATNAEVKLDTVTAQRDTAIAKLSRQPGDREDHVPAVFADARAEIAVLQRKAAVSLESLHQSVRELAEMGGGKDAAAWRDGTARMALAGLAELRMAVSAALADALAMLPEEGVVVPATLSRLSDQEVVEVAAHWRSLTRVHDYEREIRATQRHNAATAGKRGRPREMPKAPVGTAGTGSTGKRGR